MTFQSKIEVLDSFLGHVTNNDETTNSNKTGGGVRTFTTGAQVLDGLFDSLQLNNETVEICRSAFLETNQLQELQYARGVFGPEIVKIEAKKAFLEVCSKFIDELVHNDDFKYLRSVPLKDTVVKHDELLSLLSIRRMLWRGRYDDVMDLVDDLWSLERVEILNKSMEEIILAEFHQALKKIEEEYSARLAVCCMQLRRKTRYVGCNVCAYAILQNGTFYEQEKDKWVVCLSCFRSCKFKSLSFLIDDGTRKVPKTEFIQKVNTSLEKEPTVTCSICQRKYHQFCVNFIATTAESKYLCSTCMSCHPLLKHQNTIQLLPPRTEISDYIENFVNDQTLKISHIFVRVMSNVSKVHTLCPLVRDFLKTHGVASEFPYRSRLLMCFQKSDKGLVAFFGIYVQEYGSLCPPPNRNTIYISMIDSVQLFEPKKYRRIVFQMTLLAYLKYMSIKGFKTAFLWSCPPQLGTEYLFYHRPQSQQTPTALILQNWYKFLMQMGIDAEVLEKFDNLFEWCPKKTPTDFFRNFPYYADDHWPLELQNAISSYENLGVDVAERLGKTSKSKAVLRRSSGVKNKDEYVFKTILAALKKNQHSFFCMTFNSPGSLQSSTQMFDIEMPSLFTDCRDNVLNYFTENNLEFSNIRSAQFSTAAFLTKSHTGYTIIYCASCIKPVINGVLCDKCHFYVCTRCVRKKLTHKHDDKLLYRPIPWGSVKTVSNELPTYQTFVADLENSLRTEERKNDPSKEKENFPLKKESIVTQNMSSRIELSDLNSNRHYFKEELKDVDAEIFEKTYSSKRLQETIFGLTFQ